MKSPLRYPGGKTRAIKTLKEHIPEGVKEVLSPFLGGGSFELYLAENGVKVSGFDIFEPLTNFWKVALSSGKIKQEMVRRVRDIKRTGVTKETFKDMREGIDFGTEEERGAKFYVVNRTSFSGSTLSGGFSKQAERDRFTLRQIDYLEGFRQPNLTVSTGDFESVLEGNPEPDLVFLDPPYLLKQSNLYGNQGSTHKGFDHLRLRTVLERVDSRWLMTYNNSEEIKKMYTGFFFKEVDWKYGMSKSKKSSEILIANYPL